MLNIILINLNLNLINIYLKMNMNYDAGYNLWRYEIVCIH
jgi:hypothetical protein